MEAFEDIFGEMPAERIGRESVQDGRSNRNVRTGLSDYAGKLQSRSESFGIRGQVMTRHRYMTGRDFLRRAVVGTIAAVFVINSKAFGANDRFTLAGIGMGGQGRGDLDACLGFSEVQVVAVCDVVAAHCNMAKAMVDRRYGNTDCKVYNDFHDIIARDDVDAVLIGTPSKKKSSATRKPADGSTDPSVNPGAKHNHLSNLWLKRDQYGVPNSN